jgi:hypothetical protein
MCLRGPLTQQKHNGFQKQHSLGFNCMALSSIFLIESVFVYIIETIEGRASLKYRTILLQSTPRRCITVLHKLIPSVIQMKPILHSLLIPLP